MDNTGINVNYWCSHKSCLQWPSDIQDFITALFSVFIFTKTVSLDGFILLIVLPIGGKNKTIIIAFMILAKLRVFQVY